MPPYIDLASMPTAAVAAASRPRVRPENRNAEDDVDRWAGFLRELADAGPIRIGTSLPGVTLEHHGSWPGASIKGSFGIASGRRFRLRMLLGRWSRIDTSGPDAADDGRQRQLSILDMQGIALLDLGFGEDRQGSASETLTRRLAASRATSWSESAPRIGGDTEGFNSDRLRGLTAELGDSVDLIDLAEATGQLRLSPSRLRERGRANAVDAELVPCFLEALAEQALPIRIATGTAGVAHSLDCAFFCHRRDGAWQTLQSDSARLRIDTSEIDSAWISRLSHGANEQTLLRLYDARGRSLATIGSVPGFVVGENPIWRTLVNALQD
jgi:putative heme degradation protein